MKTHPKNPTLRLFTSAFLTCLIALAAIVVMAGCATGNKGPMTHAAVQAAVTLGEQIALETHPEAAPYLRAAAPVVCSASYSTNVSPAAIVAALEVAGVTNRTAILIINGALSIYNVAIMGVSTNQSEVRAYAQDLCVGLTAGLPPENALGNAERRARNVKSLPPHLK